MRDHFATIASLDLAAVIGGCKQTPPAQPQRPPSGADITVATGAQGGQAIQQALQAG